MPGTDASLLVQAPTILFLESLILGAYSFFSLGSAWSLRADSAALTFRSRNTAIAGFAAMVALWMGLTFSFGIDQTILALEIALAIVLSLIHPALSLSFFVMLLFLRPWEIFSAPGTMMAMLPRLFGLLAIASSVLYSVRSRRAELRIGTPTVLIFAFALWTFFSTFMRGDPGATQSDFTDLFLKSIILFFLVTQTIREEKSFEVFRGALIFSALGVSLVSIYRSLSAGDASERFGSFGLLANPNDISAVMVLVFPFALYTLKKRTSPTFLRVISALTLISGTLLLYFAKSRGALLGLLVTTALMAALRIKNKRVAIGGIFMAALLFVPISTAFHRSESDLTESTQSRIIYWKTASLMTLQSPLFGVGFEGYPENFERYAPAFIESGYRTAHSAWFLALAETGLIGLLLFAGSYLWAAVAAWKLRADHPELFFSVLGYGIAMSFLSHTYSLYPYLLISIVYVATRLYGNKECVAS